MRSHQVYRHLALRVARELFPHFAASFCIVDPTKKMEASVKTYRLLISVACLLGTAHPLLLAQSLPAPSRTIYKCEAAGKIAYTDEPCLGAKRMDIEPSRGLDKFSGKKMTGTDVSNENRRDRMADAISPIAGTDRKEFATDVRRHNLSGSAKAECRALDLDLAQVEANERAAARDALPAIQRDLLGLRKRFKSLRC
jgi:hypothetical protein